MALAQTNPVIGDFKTNRDQILAAIEKARNSACELLILPELALCGYPPNDFLFIPSFIAQQMQALEEIRTACRDLVVILGFIQPNPQKPGKPFLNAAAVMENGRILSTHAKVLIPTYDIFDEARYFAPGPPVHLPPLSRIPPVAITICEDIWRQEGFPEGTLYERDPVEEAIQAGAQWLINLSASPFHLGKEALRERLLQSIARRCQKPIAYVNLVGGNDSLLFDGHSLVVSAQGEKIAQAPGFEEHLLVVELDLQERKSSRGVLMKADPPLEQARKALLCGLRDYVIKCGFKTVLLGLSGGIDSALVAVLACQALGAENVFALAMPSRYSSAQSLEDAEHLARNLGMNLQVVSIEGPFERVLDDLHPLFQNRPPDITEENLQARLRGLILMALSNKFGHLLLSTGNKSELAVGYCTLYGDMNGGLAVIGDLPKTLVYALAKHINAAREIIPGRILAKPPSAELRPNQKDQDTLPPYEILDTLLTGYIEEGKDALTLAQEIARHGLEASLCLPLVEKVIGWVDRAEYKRRQAAPVLRLTTKSFGAGRRVPIAHRFSAVHGKSP